MRRTPQLRAPVDPDRPLRGYYNDLTGVALAHGGPDGARAAIAAQAADRERANPVSVAQLGLGAWQLRERGPGWAAAAGAAAAWLAAELDRGPLLEYRFALPHTYRLAPPWASAMAQGQAASLLLRTAALLEQPEHAAAAVRSLEPLVGGPSPLVVLTPDGPVLQEYPTDPPAHVLNGWIWALWGLFDASCAAPAVPPEAAARAAAAWSAGVAALGRRVHLYALAPRWSRYDLYPHRLAHAASPFYHRLHVEQLAATALLAPAHPELAATAAAWERGAASAACTAAGAARKVAFRLLEPRRPRRGRR